MERIYPRKLARQFVIDELFDLTLYKNLRRRASGETAELLDLLIPIEEKHVRFWQDFFDSRNLHLGLWKRVKLYSIIFFCRIFGEAGVHLVLEAIEVHGIKKYLEIWEFYKDDPLGSAVREVLHDEFEHEDKIVSEKISRKIHPDRIRDIFLGLNDGLVEILGAVSGFFAAFGAASAVLVASFTVAVAGSISMAAGAFVASSSAIEMSKMEMQKKKFLGEADIGGVKRSALNAGIVVGLSYLIGAMVPVLPVMFGAQNILVSIIAAGVALIIVSYILAFLSGMDVKRRIGINIVIMAIAVVVTYTIGIFAANVWGINI